MDQIGISKTEISSHSNKHHLFIIKRTFQFLVPVSLASFLLSYTCTTYYFQYFSTLVFLLFTHAFERKYMFLICNAILAFLVKTLSFNNNNSSSSSNPSSSLSVLDVHDTNDSSTKIITTQAIISEEEGAAAECAESFSPENVAALGDVDEGDKEEEERLPTRVEASLATSEAENINEGRQSRITGDFIIETEELLDDDEEYIEEEEDGSDHSGGALLGEERVDAVSMNTEELNKKFEEFIRKMKEELRIQERQQLIAV